MGPYFPELPSFLEIDELQRSQHLMANFYSSLVSGVKKIYPLVNFKSAAYSLFIMTPRVPVMEDPYAPPS